MEHVSIWTDYVQRQLLSILLYTLMPVNLESYSHKHDDDLSCVCGAGWYLAKFG